MAALSSGTLRCSITFICFIASLWTATETRSYTKPPYGYPCTRDANCRIRYFDQFTSIFADHESICIDGVCDCDESLQFKVFENGNYKCFKGTRYTSKTRYGECQANKPDTCIDGTCEKRLQDRRCFCQEGSVLVGNTCRKATIANIADSCTIPESGPVPVCDYKKSMYCNNTDMRCTCLNFTLSYSQSSASNTKGPLFYDEESGTCLSTLPYVEIYQNETLAGLDEFCGILAKAPKLCDEETMYCKNITVKTPKVCDEESMQCKDSKCKCKRKFYPVTKNGTCESYQSYVDAHNLTSYKVAPGQYCYNDAECITGLDCYKNLCACPHPCTFDKITIACDCGAVSATEGASAAILVGIIGGALIMYFWYRMIKKIVDKGKEKSQRNSGYNGVTRDPPPDDTYIPPAYDVSPNLYPSTAAYGTNDIPLKPPTTASTTSHTTGPFMDPTSSTTNSSTAAYGTNDIPLKPPTTTSPTSHTTGPFMDTTSSTTNSSTNALPYPLKPFTDAPPYPPNPSTNAPPYPPNPSSNAPPYPPDPSPNAHPYNPNLSTDAPSYPFNPPTNAPNPPNYSLPAGPVGFSSSAYLPSAPLYGAPSDGSMPPPYTPIAQNDKPGVDIYNPIIS